MFKGWLLGKSKEFQKRAKVHFSKESLKSFDMCGWAVQKDSQWREAFNEYILRMDQALSLTNTSLYVGRSKLV